MDMLGEDSKCLFHIDEHRQMCPRVDALGTGKDFSRGAMQLLAGISGAIVVATYTDVPALNALGSSTVCRYPISMPIFNVEDAMGVVPELTLPHTDKIEETIYLRKLATLKLLLYLKLKGLGLISVLHRPHKSSTTTEFLKSFQSAAAIADEYESIDVCIECCAFDPEREASLNRNAAALLVGIPDENYDQFSKLNEIVTVAGGLISASLRSLLESTDPDVMAFTYGRDLFLKMLKNSNLLDSTPLEAAYIWVLATKSAMKNTLRFLETSFEIKCDLVKSGRLFPGEDSSVIDTSLLRKNVIYPALERVDGISTHPLADSFSFRREVSLSW